MEMSPVSRLLQIRVRGVSWSHQCAGIVNGNRCSWVMSRTTDSYKVITLNGVAGGNNILNCYSKGCHLAKPFLMKRYELDWEKEILISATKAPRNRGNMWEISCVCVSSAPGFLCHLKPGSDPVAFPFDLVFSEKGAILFKLSCAC